MGQYYIAVNLDKREYCTAWDLGGGCKLWEWCVNKEVGVLPFLLRASDELGAGGDIKEQGEYAGRWAGDRICFMGDYSFGSQYEATLETFINISEGLLEEFNEFIGDGSALKGKRKEIK